MQTESIRNLIHEKIIAQFNELTDWFEDKTKNHKPLFYSSFDIRDSNFKIACVDANVFPAGFNNICEEDQNRSIELIQRYLKTYEPSAKNLLLLAEEHTRNLYYWDNVLTIQSLIKSAGFQVAVCVPGKQIRSPQKFTTASGKSIEVKILKDLKGDLIISNNDFSNSYDLPEDIPCTPPVFMGWLSRRKHNFFKEYNALTKEFADLLKIDPWHLQIETNLFSPFNPDSTESLSQLKKSASSMLAHLEEKHKHFSIKETPYLFLKNNSGTYGLGILPIQKVEDLNHWTDKSRKKMKAGKGEVKADEMILQEGILTALHTQDNKSAEPVVYVIGNQVTGAFLRSHKKKDQKANLNRPGSVFRRLCISDLEIKMKGLVMENVYGWLARLGSLALYQEMNNCSKNFKTS